VTLENLILVLREERRCLDDASTAVERLTKAMDIRMEAARVFESGCTDPTERAIVLKVMGSLHAEEWFAGLVH
jgi:hypothetical protein